MYLMWQDKAVVRVIAKINKVKDDPLKMIMRIIIVSCMHNDKIDN